MVTARAAGEAGLAHAERSELARELADAEREDAYWAGRAEVLLRRYAGQFVAVAPETGEIVAIAPDLAGLVAELGTRRRSLADVWSRFVDPAETPLVL